MKGSTGILVIRLTSKPSVGAAVGVVSERWGLADDVADLVEDSPARPKSSPRREVTGFVSEERASYP